MKSLTVCLFALTLISSTACSKKTTPASSASPAEPTASTSSVKSDSSIQDNYRFVVSFYSIGEGTEREQINNFEIFILDYGKKFNTTLAYEKSHWGREGEVNYCLRLSEIGISEQQTFIDEARKLLSSAKLVHFSEHTACGGRRKK